MPMLSKSSDMPDFSFGEEDFKAEIKGNEVDVRFNSDVVSVEKMLSYTLEKVHVKDINVKDADIEEIIRRLYLGGGELLEETAQTL